jgi:hypothetical protein
MYLKRLNGKSQVKEADGKSQSGTPGEENERIGQ